MMSCKTTAAVSFLCLTLAACTTSPLKSPTTLVAPHPQISKKQFIEDSERCKSIASTASEVEREKSLHLDHIGVGGFAGYIAGLVVPGGSSLTALTGAAAGAALGLRDTLIGYRGAYRERELAVLNNAYQICMFESGHVVPGLPILPTSSNNK